MKRLDFGGIFAAVASLFARPQPRGAFNEPNFAENSNGDFHHDRGGKSGKGKSRNHSRGRKPRVGSSRRASRRRRRGEI